MSDMTQQRTVKPTRRRLRVGYALRVLATHAFLLAGALFMLLPFMWMLITSIKPPDEVFSATLSFWPKQFYGLENYRFALTAAPLLRVAFNGVVLCGSILFVQLAVAIPCAYALAKLKFPGRDLLYWARGSWSAQHLFFDDGAVFPIGFCHFFAASIF
jgi:multiple sugar transport system permease protein